jgi:hypothetical protein
VTELVICEADGLARPRLVVHQQLDRLPVAHWHDQFSSVFGQSPAPSQRRGGHEPSFAP